MHASGPLKLTSAATRATTQHQFCTQPDLRRQHQFLQRVAHISAFVRPRARLGLSHALVLGHARAAVPARLSAPRSIAYMIAAANAFLEHIGEQRARTPAYPEDGADFYIAVYDHLAILWKRGPSVPVSARHALPTFASALSISWNLSHPPVMSAAPSSEEATPRQAPAMPVELVVVLERIATDASRPFPRRLFAATILLMSYVALRFHAYRA